MCPPAGQVRAPEKAGKIPHAVRTMGLYPAQILTIFHANLNLFESEKLPLQAAAVSKFIREKFTDRFRVTQDREPATSNPIW